MTNDMPFEGHQDHPHIHEPSQRQPMPPVEPLPREAIQSGAQLWLAREFVGGLIAMAQSHETDVADFLADRCVYLAMRAASGEAEVEVLRTQVQAFTTQIESLQRQIDDCPCHDDDVTTGIVTGITAPEPFPSAPSTVNGGPSS